MSRYKDEQCRICRREGQKLFLKVQDVILINVVFLEETTHQDNMDKKEQNFLNTVLNQEKNKKQNHTME